MPAKKAASRKRAKPTAKKSSRRRTTAPTRRSRFSGVWWKAALVLGLLSALWLAYLDARVSGQFSGALWTVPAKVYARPLELYEGKPLSRSGMLEELALLGYRQVERPREPGQFSRGGDRFELVSRSFTFADGFDASARIRFSLIDDVVRGFTSPEQHTLVRLEPLQIGGFYPAHNEDRLLVTVDDFPPFFEQTLLTVEDRDFYQHWGLSPKAIGRALWANVTAGRVTQGGSTLTQQLVKNLFLSRERSLLRKANEAVMALLLEWRHSKTDILQAYVNEVFLGQDGQRAIHGFGLASQFYFAKPFAQLKLHETALLVGMVKGATYYNPRRHPERARERRNLVLRLLLDNGLINRQTHDWAASRPLGLATVPGYHQNRYPAFLALVKRQLARDYAETDLREAGLQIFTSLDPIAQHQAERAVATQVATFAQQGDPHRDIQGALVVTSTRNAEVVALVGDRDPRFAGFNRALDAYRPIGSLIKPAVYLAALRRGDYHLLTPVDDSPITLKLADGSLWQPQNFSETSHGPTPLFKALAHSYNQATARLALDIGLPAIADTLRDLGYDKTVPAYPSLALGAINMSPFEVAELYQTIAQDGFASPLRAIRAVTTASGEPLSRYSLAVRQTVDADAVHLLQYALQVATHEGTARSIYQRLSPALNSAGKTGTTNDMRDSWFAGFSGDYLAVAWVGNDDNSPTQLTGSRGALPVWVAFMAGLPQFPLAPRPPDGVHYVHVDDSLGGQVSARCSSARLVPFRHGQEPAQGACSARGQGLGGWLQRFLRLP